MTAIEDLDECPFCGASLSADATVCRRCGASEEYGWNSVENPLDEFGADYGEDDFDYDDFVAREFPEQADGRASSKSGFQNPPTMTMRIVILALLVSLIVAFVFM